MGSQRTDTQIRTLREHLRGATAHSHNMLDTSMRPASDWRSRLDYARFLNAQYTARASVELWLSMFATPGLKPPEQTPFIAHDLARLGEPIPVGQPNFDMGFNGDATTIGVAWVLAGSSLGNRAILQDMHRSLPQGTYWPQEFLASRAMTRFWKELRSRVEVPVSQDKADEATRAARCVFEHFLGVARSDASSPVMEAAL